VRRALSSPQDKDERLRNTLYTELNKRNHKINFPASSEHWIADRKLRSGLNLDYRYKEYDLAHLVLNEFHRQREGDEHLKNVVHMARLLRGLNVTTTSLPDMTVPRERYLYFGEFKNNDNYTDEKPPSSAPSISMLSLAVFEFLLRN